MPKSGCSTASSVQSRRSPYKLTPDMRLTRRATDAEHFADGIAHADRALDELAACLKA